MEKVHEGCRFWSTEDTRWVYVNLVGRLDGFYVIVYASDDGGPLDEDDVCGMLDTWDEALDQYKREVVHQADCSAEEFMKDEEGEE